MTVDVTCPNCKTLYTIRRELLGKRTKCTRCATAFVLTEPAASPPERNVSDTPPVAQQPAEAIPNIRIEPQAAASEPAIQADRHQRVRATRAESGDLFWLLRLLARGCEILAAIMAAVGVLILIRLFIALVQFPSAWLAALLTTGLTVFWTGLISGALLVSAQLIRLLLRMEQNTRQTQEACTRLADHLSAIEVDS